MGQCIEILVHTGPGGNADFIAVCNMLALADQTPLPPPPPGHTVPLLSRWLYQQIYARRNAFLHGDPVDLSDLYLPGARGDLSQYAAVLYRLLLVAFFDLNATGPVPPIADTEAFAEAVVVRADLNSYQRTIMPALLSARPNPTATT